MQYYEYRVPASGAVTGETDYELDLLKIYMNRYKHLFPKGGTGIAEIRAEKEDGRITAFFIDAYSAVIPKQYPEFTAAMERQCAKHHFPFTMDGGLELLSEPEIPKTLYHITGEGNLDTIRKGGLRPQAGGNDWQSGRPYVYLCEEGDLAPWLATLRFVDGPATVLRVDTDGLAVEPGRYFTDRAYDFGEYRTAKTVPPDRFSTVDLSEEPELSAGIRERMVSMLHSVSNPDSVGEAERGLDRLSEAGVLDPGQARYLVDSHRAVLSEHPLDWREYYGRAADLGTSVDDLSLPDDDLTQ